MYEDVRWQQRFANYQKALSQLENAVDLAQQRKLSDLEKQGVIQAFEFTYELAWNTLKDFYENQGETGIQGSRDAIRLAFARGLIDNGDLWMKMIKDRAATSHTYNEETVDLIITDVCESYMNEFRELRERLGQIEKNRMG